MNKVRQYYNSHTQEEDNRLQYHAFELPVTMHFIKHYLPAGSRIFDTACGTGNYATELLKNDYQIALNDLSDKNIEFARNKIGNNKNVLFYECSDALQAKGWKKQSWDAVLILGPLYHMLSKENRISLMQKSYEHLKPGGYVFASFMSRTGALIYGLKHNPKGILYDDGARQLWETGFDKRFIEETGTFVSAYFSHPDEIPSLFEKSGLKLLNLAGVEGVFGERFELYHQMDDDLQKAWLRFIMDHCQENEMLCNAKHLLAIGKKPG